MDVNVCLKASELSTLQATLNWTTNGQHVRLGNNALLYMFVTAADARAIAKAWADIADEIIDPVIHDVA